MDSSADAMDRMMRNRAPAGGSRDLDLEVESADVNYEAALGQAPSGGFVVQRGGIIPQGEASPGTLEQGGVALPVASPFYSERVQTEVELLRRRPLTLDEDAQRVGTNSEDVGLGEDFSAVRTREPPYDQGLSGRDSQVRVARLEHPTETAVRAEMSQPAEELGVSRGRQEPAVGLVPNTATHSVTGMPTTPLGGTTAPGDALSERSRLSAAGSGTRPTESMIGRSSLGDRPLPGDPRELVPATGSIAGTTELLLMQALQENRMLKVKIEQMESQSSWHSGRAPTTPREQDQVPQGSPVSFVHPHMSVVMTEADRAPQVNPQTQVAAVNTVRGLGLPDQAVGMSGVQFPSGREHSAVQLFGQSAHVRVPNQSQRVPGPGGLQGYGSGCGVTDGYREMQGQLLDTRGSQATVVEGMQFSQVQPHSFLPVPMARPPPSPIPSRTPDIPRIPMSMVSVGRLEDLRVPDVTGVGFGASGEFQMSRESRMGTGEWGLSVDGYPVSPGGTVIRPPPLPPSRTPTPEIPRVDPPALTLPNPCNLAVSGTGHLDYPTSFPKQDNRPEEPAKYINELPKLQAADISTSAVACGNWLAQLRQIFAGLSPSAVEWWQAVEVAASKHYQRWLIADPLDRLSLDPRGVIAIFDEGRFQRVESRAVSLILAAIPQHIRDEAVSNRWLSSAALLFRLQCIYQPGGASERSMLLSQLTMPEVVNSVKTAVAMLRKWQQNFYRVRELGASMPDPSLLLSGIDKATASLLSQHHSLGFRVNAFRHKVALDYNPTVTSIVQLVRLLQAECEASALGSMEGSAPDKKARAAVARTEALPDNGHAKAHPPNKPEEQPLPPSAKALEGQDKSPKGKGKGKNKGSASELGPCHSFAEGKGCKFGDSCKFKHDRATARKQRRCLACGQDGHFRPECPLVAPEDRQVMPQSDNSNPSSPKTPSKASSPTKPKSGPQAKGLIEDNVASSSGTGTSAVTAEGSTKAQEALLAEAAKLLKNVSLKHLSLSEGKDALQELGIDEGWLISAVTSASDSNFALVDSGATNALRPATAQEIEVARKIKVDLAAGGTYLHINEHGTLLSSQPCQVILPAGYLVQLGFAITWRKKGCIIKRKGQPALEVVLAKGCPLISKEQGPCLLAEYEALKDQGGLSTGKASMLGLSDPIPKHQLRRWLAHRVARGQLTRTEQLLWLHSAFPEAPPEYLEQVAGHDINFQSPSLEGVPWNRRKRRSVSRAKPGEVLLHLFSGVQKWNGPGMVLEIDKCVGSDLMQASVYQHLLGWAVRGVVGGVVGGPPCRTVSRCRNESDGGPPPLRDRDAGRWGLPGLPGDLAQLVREDSVLWLRFLFIHAVAQAAADGPPEQQYVSELEAALNGDIVIPPEITTPFELAKWALQKAADKLHQQGSPVQSSFHSPSAVNPKRSVMLTWEHPRDPEEYADREKAPSTGYVSFFAFPEWQLYAELYEVHIAKFDQGCLGHRRPKPSMVGTTSWYLYEHLDQRFLTPQQRATFGKGPQSKRSRINEVPGWAVWAPGLTVLVRQAWSRWLSEHAIQPEAEARSILLAKLTEEQKWQLHQANDHIPYMRGCPTCITAQARQRSHWRSSCTNVHSASFDLAGPFVPGRAFDPTVSGRDRGGGYKYFLACSFSVPAPEEGSVEPEGLEPIAPSGGDEGSAGEALDDGAGVAFHLDKVTTRVRNKRPEDPDSLAPPEEELPLPPPPTPPGTRTLFMGTPLRSKHAKEVVPAVQAMIN